MDAIPPEILLQIFDYVPGPAPSETRLHEQPSLDLLNTHPECPTASLKAVSLVSTAWRSLALPCLFRHVLWKPRVYSLSAFTLNPIPLLRFLTENKLSRAVTTFTMIIDYDDSAATDYLIAPQIRPTDLEWLWDQLFSVIDPLRFTVLARPTSLAAILSRMLYLDDAWSFAIPYHILSLARPTRRLGAKYNQDDNQPSAPPAPSVRRRTALSLPARAKTPVPSPLFTVRPWTSLLLNEGSSTKVYRVYEYFLRRPPSMLGALLGCEEFPNDTALIPPTVVDFNYISIFPLSSHFEILLEHLPKVERLYVQLIPKPGNEILQDAEEMKHVQPSDFWMERDTAFDLLMRELTSIDNLRANWNTLRVFETGDAAADQGFWHFVVEYLKNSNMEEWKVERRGVFVRHIDDGKPLGWSQEVNGHNYSDPDSRLRVINTDS
ncbi:hypothetical protein F4777DRAFT_76665 [Nemania sp. FL0916]|nr:hypothetical protein F4777DRAFT_76665 [Nemania sp. FL0916]